LDRDEPAALLLDLGNHHLAREREGHIDQPLGGVRDAVPLCAQFADCKALGHRLRAASRNSRLPSPPSMGDGTRPRTCQPSFVWSHAAISWAISSAFSGSRSRPPLPIASRPASNCGLTRKRPCAPLSAMASAGGSASFREMKLTSPTRK